MAITLSSLKSHVRHALGGTPASQLSEAGIVNEAGRYMFSVPWKFRERPPATVTMTANQSYVELPTDFGEMISANMSDGLVKSIHFTTMDDLVERRTTAIGQSQEYWAVILHPTSEATTGGAEAPRMELHPTPTSADSVVVAYRSDWFELTSDEEYAHVPGYAESVLISLVRAFALGYEEDGLEVRVAEVQNGPLFQRLLEKDGIIQPDYGPIKNGALSQVVSGYHLPWDSTSDPS